MFVLLKNNTVEKYPYSVRELRKDNPQYSFPKQPSTESLAQFGMFPVADVDVEINRKTQVLTEITPVYNEQEGRWERSFDIRDKTQDELNDDETKQATLIRNHRNKMLSDTDWTQVDDAPVDKTQWAAYRQELRDISTQLGFPWEVNWPTYP